MSKTKMFGGNRCPNCGEYGLHFVPPSCGEEGFFLCEKRIPKANTKTNQSLQPTAKGSGDTKAVHSG